MNDDNVTLDLRAGQQRQILSTLADLRDARIVMSAILEPLDGSVSGFVAELRALRSQFDRFRTELRERFAEQEP